VEALARETGPVDMPDPSADAPAVPDDDEMRKLDAAIAALPEHLRAAVVLCEMEGRSRKEAAKQLGLSEGTLSSRLADARKRLGRQLRPTVVGVTVGLAARTAEAVVGGSTSETVRTLARGVMSMLLLNKLKAPALIVLAMTMAALSLPLMIPAYAAPVPKGLKPPVGGIGVIRGRMLHLLTPDGTTTLTFDVYDRWDLDWTQQWKVHVSPNGFPVAVVIPRSGRQAQKRGGGSWFELRLLRSVDDEQGEVVNVEDQFTGELVWSRTGTRFYAGVLDTTTRKTKYLVIDPTTGRATESVVPDGHVLIAELADGTLVTDGTQSKLDALGKEPDPPNPRLWYPYKVSADGKTVTELPSCPRPENGFAFDISPDGGELLTWRFDKAADTDVLIRLDLTTGRTTDIEPKALKGTPVEMHQAKWSPDGKRVGFISSGREHWRGFDPDCTLHVCDLDGTNGADIITWRGRKLGEVWDAHFEWK